jgi:hypothetical protein
MKVSIKHVSFLPIPETRKNHAHVNIPRLNDFMSASQRLEGQTGRARPAGKIRGAVIIGSVAGVATVVLIDRVKGHTKPPEEKTMQHWSWKLNLFFQKLYAVIHLSLFNGITSGFVNNK